MPDLRLGPPVGSLGGAQVESMLLELDVPNGSGEHPVATLPIPEGKRCRVVVIIDSAVGGGNNVGNLPELRIGGVLVTKYSRDFLGGGGVVVTGPVAITSTAMGGSVTSNPSFTGTAYWWEEKE